jgi:hypothetical protein
MGAGQSTGGVSGGGDGGRSAQATTRSSAEDAADRLQAGLAQAVDSAQVSAIFPVQKASLQCTLRCFDSAKSPADLHAW